MGKKSAAAPDTVGAAREQGEQARILNQEQTVANRVNQNNAWGSVSWQPEAWLDPASGQEMTRWTQSETLAAPLQNAVNNQMGMTETRSELASNSLDRAANDYAQPMNFEQYGSPVQFNPEARAEGFNYDQFNYDLGGGRQAAEDAAYGRATSRLDPQFEQQAQAMETKLRNQGLRQGDQAYDAAMANFNRARNDAYEQARLGSTLEGRSEADLSFNQALGLNNTQFGQGLSANQQNAAIQNQNYSQGVNNNQIANQLRQQQIQEDLYKRDFNLNEADRLLQGQIIQGGPPSSGGTTATGQGETVGQKYLGG